ncbi:MAG: hypothetical protein JJE47_08535 [Acidimicrobiia bacterium]|nr:hypothetical protein [Acidimicrobiia bacterium]
MAAELADLPDDAFRQKYDLSIRMDTIRAALPAVHNDCWTDGGRYGDRAARTLPSSRQIMTTSAIAITPMSDRADGSGNPAHVVLRQQLLHSGDWTRARIGELESATDRVKAGD